MDNWLYDLLELPEACQVEEALPKHFLSANFELTSGQRHLLNYVIDQMTIVGVIGPDHGGVPLYNGGDVSMETVVLLLVETKGGKFKKEASKVANMLQDLLPQYLLLGITDGECACVSIASKCKSQEEGTTLVVKESFLTPLLLPENMSVLSEKLSFQNIDKENIKILWDNYCQVIGE